MARRLPATTVIANYVNELESKGGKAFDFVLDNDLDISVEWSSHRFDDGVPVRKMFGRNDDVQLFLEAGTRIRGVSYQGSSSRVPMADFYLNGVWYSSNGAEILAWCS